MGKHTRSLLKGIKTIKGYESRYKKSTKESQSNRSQPNGCLMRASPLALLKNHDHVIADCKLTHPHPVCVESVRIYVDVLRWIIEGNAAKSIIMWMKFLEFW